MSSERVTQGEPIAAWPTTHGPNSLILFGMPSDSNIWLSASENSHRAFLRERLTQNSEPLGGSYGWCDACEELDKLGPFVRSSLIKNMLQVRLDCGLTDSQRLRHLFYAPVWR
jgi:hypothetical protein